MAFQLDFGIWGQIFAVPTAIVDKHIRLCGSASLKVLLVLLRYSQEDITLSRIAELVGLSEADTQDALNYWTASGVIRCTPSGGDILVTPGETAAPVPPKAPPAPADPVPAPDVPAVSEAEEQRVVRLSSRPRLTPDVIADMAKENGEIRSLIQEAQVLLGKPLSPSATESLVSLYSYGGMSVEVILTVIQYCVSIQKDSIRYIEATAYGWMDKGIDSLDKAERYILEKTQADENEKKVRAAFGIRDRDLTGKESDYAAKWTGVYHFDEAMLRLAYERTIDGKGRLSFPYCDGILTRWHEKGISTPKQAVDEMNTPPARPDAPASAPSGTGRSVNSGGAVQERERYDRAHAELQSRRTAAREEHNRRREETYARIPRLREIEATLAKTGFEVSRAVLKGGNASSLIQSLREKNLSLQKERAELLAEAGYPEDYLDIPYHCRQCEDKGYRPDGEACDCLKELLRNL